MPGCDVLVLARELATGAARGDAAEVTCSSRPLEGVARAALARSSAVKTATPPARSGYGAKVTVVPVKLNGSLES